MSLPTPPTPANEAQRLARLRELMLLDTPPEPVFDELTRWAAEVCGAPIALVSLIDHDRQWFKANHGLPGATETPRDLAFCAHAIVSDALMEVQDATLDTRFAHHPAVLGAPRVRFYAGAPLTLPSGECLGTLCVVDHVPRQLSAEQAATLCRLARIATQTIVMRGGLLGRALNARSRYEQALSASESQHRAIVEEQSELISLAQEDGTLVYVNPAYARSFGLTPEALIGRNLFEFVEPADRALVRDRIDWVLSCGEPIVGENRMHASHGDEVWVAWTNRLQLQPDGQRWVRSVGQDISARKRAEAARRASEDLLRRTGRVAGVGGWELDIASSRVTWSEQTRRIHEVPADYQPTLSGALDFYADDQARQRISQVVQQAMAQGGGWDLELPLRTAAGRAIWVRAVGEAEFEDGRAVRLVGALQDISERHALQQRMADNEHALRVLTTILDQSTDFVLQSNPEGELLYMNPAARRVVGLAPDAPLAGRRITEFNTPETNCLITRELLPAVLREGVWRGETQVRAADGKVLPVSHLSIAHRDAAGRLIRYSSVLRDISAEVAIRDELQRQSATLRSVTETLPVIVSAVDLQLRYRFVNSAFEQWHGYGRQAVLGRSARDLLSPEDLAQSLARAQRALAGETVHFERHYPHRPGQPTLSISYIPVHMEDGRIDGFIGVAYDITPHRQEQTRLRSLVERDALTGLLNRGGFQAALEHAIAAGQGPGLALLYVDLDRFKPVNDDHGHAAGDAVLQVIGQRLARLVRSSDAVARLGGDEFALLLTGVRDHAGAEHVAAKVVAAAAEPVPWGGLGLQIGASVGLALGVHGSDDGTALLQRADAQLYRAKAQGRGRHLGEAPSGLMSTGAVPADAPGGMPRRPAES